MQQQQWAPKEESPHSPKHKNCLGLAWALVSICLYVWHLRYGTLVLSLEGKFCTGLVTLLAATDINPRTLQYCI